MHNFELNIIWCLEELEKDKQINEQDKRLIQTTYRTKEQMKWHALQWIAHFNLSNLLFPKEKLTIKYLMEWLSEKSKVPVYTIDPLEIDVPSCTAVMSQEFAYCNKILAVKVTADEIWIGTDQPFQLDWLESLTQSILPKKIVKVLLFPEQLHRYLNEFYQVSRAVSGSQKATAFLKENKGIEALLELNHTQSPDANDQHIVKLVDWILQFAFGQSASDIHLEPRKEIGKVRFRIDGVLHTVYQMPVNTLTAVISRLKILGRMNVAEKRKPQDGRLKTRTALGQETELRLATLPTAFGEKLVMRIFNPDVMVRSFQDLGFDDQLLKQWKQLTEHRHGIVLVTGPTGSGKTTTLYSTLKQLATDQVNVCTIEDPIEMLEASFNQMQVNYNIDLSFADGIRALMRQDPDIIMVGEIRDYDTANMAIQAALTGHLVISTLHTNDAPSSLIRLHDLGIQPFLTGATLLAVLAQRLIRTLCEGCKQTAVINKQEWQQLTYDFDIPCPSFVFQAVGCGQCRNTGYKGRIGIYEFMPMTLQCKQLIAQNSNLNVLKAQIKKDGIEPLRIAGAYKIIAGITTIDEVLRVVPLG